MRWQRVFFFFPLLICICFLYRSFQPIDGLIGHDYNHALPRLLIGAVHFWQNGFSILHYTPSLCGGLPVYADPQAYLFSLPQFLTFVFDPHFASVLSILLFYVVGYFGALLLLQKVFRLDEDVCHLGALLFLLNGFCFENLLVGHLTHQPFLLLPWMLFFLLTPRNKHFFRDCCLFALIWIYLILSGSVHILILFAGVMVFFIPELFRRLDREQRRRQFRFLINSFALVALASAGKLSAVIQYSPVFFTRPVFASAEDLFTLTFRYFWFVPGKELPELPFGLLAMGGWEYVGFFSKFSLIALLYLGRRACRRSPSPKKPELYYWLIYTAMSAVIILLATGRLYNRELPFFSTYHNPIKLMSILLPGLWIISALVLQQLARHPRITNLNRRYRLLLFLFVALLFFTEFQQSAKTFLDHKTGIGYKYNPEPYQKLKALGHLPAVTQVIPYTKEEGDAIAAGQSSLICYEPLLGYRLENLSTRVRPGPTGTLHEHKFNLTHPGCLVYPDFYQCERWDRIPENQSNEFRLFISGFQPWPIPPWQNAVNRFSLALVLLLFVIGFGGLWGSPRSSLR